jgi:acylphosphatase
MSAKTSEKCLHIYFEGRVQGVGFRYTSRAFAHRYNLKGWVMNLADGRVESLIQGDGQGLDNYLRDLKNEFLHYITDIQVEEHALNEHIKGFEIRFLGYH